jgi:hypothetical protein
MRQQAGNELPESGAGGQADPDGNSCNQFCIHFFFLLPAGGRYREALLSLLPQSVTTLKIRPSVSLHTFVIKMNRISPSVEVKIKISRTLNLSGQAYES